jgi:hypothetical protein
VEHPALAEALADGEVQKRASKITILWHRANEQRIADLRRADAIRVNLNRSHVQRMLNNIVRAFTTKHEVRLRGPVSPSASHAWPRPARLTMRRT